MDTKPIKTNAGRIRMGIGIGLTLAIWLALTLSGPSNTVSAASGTSYTTDFPLTENPISEGGKWINGKATGVEWGNVYTSQGNVHGVKLSTQYADPTAVLSGAWGPDQTAQATIELQGVPNTCCHEVELRLRTTITAYSITGYEINCSVSGNDYLQIVRWNGPLASFTQIGGVGMNCHNGDVLKATIVGNKITAFLNGSPVTSATDITFTNGSPGVGFYDQTDNDWNTFGFSNFAASDTGGAALSISTASLPGATVGTPYSTTISASGGTAPYTFSGSTSAPGLTLSSNGAVAGTPTASGSFSVSVTARDSVGATANATIPLAVTGQTQSGTLSESCRISGGNVVCTITPSNMPSQTVITVTGSGGGANVTQSVTLP